MQQTLADKQSKGGTLKVRADKGAIFVSSRKNPNHSHIDKYYQ